MSALNDFTAHGYKATVPPGGKLETLLMGRRHWNRRALHPRDSGPQKPFPGPKKIILPMPIGYT